MTVGEPDFDTPDTVKAEAHAATDRGETEYTPVNGTPRLRDAIRADFRRRLGLDCAADEICVGGGAKQILFLALMADVEAGGEVIVPAPYWVSYPDMVVVNDGTPVVVECPEADGFKLTPRSLEAAIAPRTRWPILNSPSNPTGAAICAPRSRRWAPCWRATPRSGSSATRSTTRSGSLTSRWSASCPPCRR